MQHFKKMNDAILLHSKKKKCQARFNRIDFVVVIAAVIVVLTATTTQSRGIEN